jgi:hypothetical protein
MDLVEDRAEIFVMDPLGQLRNNFQGPLAEDKYIYCSNLYSSWLQMYRKKVDRCIPS